MKTVTIEGITAKEVLSSLAASFEVNKDENYGEYSLPIHKPKGEGMISGINFPNGIGLFRFNLKLNEDYCIDFCSKIVCVCSDVPSWLQIGQSEMFTYSRR